MRTAFRLLTAFTALSLLFTQCRDARIMKGNQAPEFIAKSIDGNEVRLSSYRGKIVVVLFWASCCTDFTVAFPRLQNAYQELMSDDFVLVTVNVGETKSIAKIAANLQGMKIPILLDEQSEIARLYAITSIPVAFIISKDGKVADILLGWPSEKYLRNSINRLRSEGKDG
ncbi:MAG TPA: TlpA disulfide reductase family protein [Bacteroidota bacterium]|nr:TlpA disulfide reductase family protein [Bacteroidota bacterium]